jgi:hypothetical protein
MLLHFRICLFEEEAYTPAATTIGYDFRSVRRRRNQQPPQTDKVITTSASPRLLKPCILLKEQTRRSRRRRRRRRRSPGASKGFKQPGRISSKDEDKKNKEPNKLSKITQSFPRKKKRHSKLYQKNRQMLHKNLYVEEQQQQQIRQSSK